MEFKGYAFLKEELFCGKQMRTIKIREISIRNEIFHTKQKTCRYFRKPMLLRDVFSSSQMWCLMERTQLYNLKVSKPSKHNALIRYCYSNGKDLISFHQCQIVTKDTLSCLEYFKNGEQNPFNWYTYIIHNWPLQPCSHDYTQHHSCYVSSF